MRGGQLPQFFIDQRQDLVGSERIAGFNPPQDFGEFAHRLPGPFILPGRVYPRPAPEVSVSLTLPARPAGRLFKVAAPGRDVDQLIQNQEVKVLGACCISEDGQRNNDLGQKRRSGIAFAPNGRRRGFGRCIQTARRCS